VSIAIAVILAIVAGAVGFLAAKRTVFSLPFITKSRRPGENVHYYLLKEKYEPKRLLRYCTLGTEKPILTPF
jgi:hypothetical protein